MAVICDTRPKMKKIRDRDVSGPGKEQSLTGVLISNSVLVVIGVALGVLLAQYSSEFFSNQINV